MIYKIDKDILFIRLDDGEKIFESIYEIFEKENIVSGIVLNGIGMLKDFEIGWFNISTKKYEKEFISVPHELITTNGNISLNKNAPFAHLHVALGGPSRSVIGGHLFNGTVCNTIEMFVKILNIKLYREEGETFKPLNFK
ncbi:DNA-binding protein [Marinitoga sp. 1137]|uniref:PPC domain-containing DNA-binding protein n=1 Tax=Marinitoga sp. 1137 TaxID=1545835 RepID=UPI0009504E34|nr:PPC domain-containing DNA-binding protein [Marinitoga sp. 1137]APT75204.1 DNA-binding protein [Marinitoga sp. 1137]